MLHRLGVRTTAVVALGGMPGEILRAELEAEQVPMVAVPTAADTRRSATVLAVSTAEHYRLVTEGRGLAEREWRAAVSAVATSGRDTEFVVVSGSLPPGVPAAVIDEIGAVAHRLGARLVVDSSGPALRAAVDAGAFLVKPNRRELAELAGAGPELDVAAAARGLLDRGVHAVVVSLGSDGALLVAHDVEVHVPTAPVAVVSAVGAGDSTLAGILAGLVEGRSPADALRLGMAAGAAACLTGGSELCRPADVRRLHAVLAGA